VWPPRCLHDDRVLQEPQRPRSGSFERPGASWCRRTGSPTHPVAGWVFAAALARIAALMASIESISSATLGHQRHAACSQGCEWRRR